MMLLLLLPFQALSNKLKQRHKPPKMELKLPSGRLKRNVALNLDTFKGRQPRHHALSICLPGIGSASAARDVGALKVSAKY